MTNVPLNLTENDVAEHARAAMKVAFSAVREELVGLAEFLEKEEQEERGEENVLHVVFDPKKQRSLLADELDELRRLLHLWNQLRVSCAYLNQEAADIEALFMFLDKDPARHKELYNRMWHEYHLNPTQGSQAEARLEIYRAAVRSTISANSVRIKHFVNDLMRVEELSKIIVNYWNSYNDHLAEILGMTANDPRVLQSDALLASLREDSHKQSETLRHILEKLFHDEYMLLDLGIAGKAEDFTTRLGMKFTEPPEEI